MAREYFQNAKVSLENCRQPQRITTLLFLLINWISFSYLRAKIPPSKEISEGLYSPCETHTL